MIAISAWNVTVLEEIPLNFGDDADIWPDIRFIDFLNIQWICMKLNARVHKIIITYFRKFKLDPDIWPDIRPDFRHNPTNHQNCTKFGMNSQYVLIKKRNNCGNDPTLFGSVIRPDIQLDIRFGHIIMNRFVRNLVEVCILSFLSTPESLNLIRISGRISDLSIFLIIVLRWKWG